MRNGDGGWTGGLGIVDASIKSNVLFSLFFLYIMLLCHIFRVFIWDAWISSFGFRVDVLGVFFMYLLFTYGNDNSIISTIGVLSRLCSTYIVQCICLTLSKCLIESL